MSPANCQSRSDQSRSGQSRSRGALRAALFAAALFAAGCGADETINPSPGGSTTTAESTTTTTSDSTGTGGSGGTGGGTTTSAPLRTVEKRNPFGNVAATDNLLWDGDFEWSSPFSDQYGWLSGPPYSYEFPAATIGPACRSGIKCVTLAKNKSVIGIGVGSTTSSLAVTVFVRPKVGVCADMDVSLISLFGSDSNDVEVPPISAEVDAAGWCRHRTTVASYPSKVYLLIDNNTGDEVVVDDAVVRPVPPGAAPPAPPPQVAPLTKERMFRRDLAREAIAKRRGPYDPPPNAARRAFEEQHPQ